MARLHFILSALALVIGSVAVSQEDIKEIDPNEEILGFTPFLLSSDNNSHARNIFTEYKIYSRKGKGRGFLTNPVGITYCEGMIFVAEVENHRVQAYRENGTFVYMIGRGAGSVIGEQFKFPHGISCYGGLLYVADTENSRIQIFHAINGSFINMFARRPNCFYAELGFPHDVTVCDRVVTILDTYNHRLQMFPLDASYIRRVGSRGHRKNHFEYPEAITCDNHLLYIADTHNNRIKSYTSSGEFVRVYDLLSNAPNAVAACNGRLFVSDPLTNRLAEYSIATGEFIFSIGSEGAGKYQFEKIGGLFCDNGVLFVTDYGNNRFHIIPPEVILAKEQEEGFEMDPFTGEKLSSRYQVEEDEEDEL